MYRILVYIDMSLNQHNQEVRKKMYETDRERAKTLNLHLKMSVIIAFPENALVSHLRNALPSKMSVRIKKQTFGASC